MNYAVTIDFEIEADSPQEAAEIARQLMSDPDNSLEMSVCDVNGNITIIVLPEEE